MFKDSFDKICLFFLVLVICSLLVVLVSNRGRSEGKTAPGLDKAMEREMATRARLELIGKLYAPVEELRRTGNNQSALLKLNELIGKYPGEAHGHILLGEILRDMGALDEAVSSFVEGVKLNGDYVDANCQLSRREEIKRLVDEGLKSIGERAVTNPGNRSLSVPKQKLNYLKSRLAGGCE